jgi:hypothetical protein
MEPAEGDEEDEPNDRCDKNFGDEAEIDDDSRATSLSVAHGTPRSCFRFPARVVHRGIIPVPLPTLPLGSRRIDFA